MIPIKIRTEIGQKETWLATDKAIRINLHGLNVNHLRLVVRENGQVELDMIPCPVHCPNHPENRVQLPVRLIEFES